MCDTERVGKDLINIVNAKVCVFVCVFATQLKFLDWEEPHSHNETSPALFHVGFQ